MGMKIVCFPHKYFYPQLIHTLVHRFFIFLSSSLFVFPSYPFPPLTKLPKTHTLFHALIVTITNEYNDKLL